MTEVWKDIEGYEGQYQVSSLGRVRSLDRYVQRPHSKTGKIVNFLVKGQLIKTRKNNTNDYIVVVLSDGHRHQKTKLVHRLVAQAFLPNPNNLQEVNHLDENKENNIVSNLEWCSRIDNVRYGTGVARNGVLHRVAVLQCNEHGDVIRRWDSIKQAAQAFGVTHGAIGNICKCKGTAKTCKGFRWRYADNTNTKR